MVKGMMWCCLEGRVYSNENKAIYKGCSCIGGIDFWKTKVETPRTEGISSTYQFAGLQSRNRGKTLALIASDTSRHNTSHELR